MIAGKNILQCKVLSSTQRTFAPKVSIAIQVPGKVSKRKWNDKDFIVSTYWGPCTLFVDFADEVGYTPQLYDIIRVDITKQDRFQFCRNMSLLFRPEPRSLEQVRKIEEWNAKIGQAEPGERSQELLRAALEEFPNDKYLMTKLVAELLHKRTSRPQDATPLIERLMVVAPVDVVVQTLAAKHALQLGDNKRAKTHAFYLHKMDPKHSYAFYVYGEVSHRERNYELAKINFKKSLVLFPEDVPSLIGLADIAEVEGDLVLSRTYMSQVLEIRRRIGG